MRSGVIDYSIVYTGSDLTEEVCLSGEFSARQAKKGSGKNENSRFCLLGLKYTLRTCFESKNFLPKSCPELSNQVLSFSEGQIY